MKRDRADCTVMALAVVAELPYEEAAALAAAAGRKPNSGFNSQRLIEHAKKAKGLEFKRLRMERRKTVARFARENPSGRFYVRKAGHAFAVIDGRVSDSTSAGSLIKAAWAFAGRAAASWQLAPVPVQMSLFN